MLQNVTIETAETAVEHLGPLHPVGAVAALLARRIDRADAPTLVYVAQSMRRRRDIADLMRVLVGSERVAELAGLEGVPGDGMPASAAAMGERMSTLRWLLDDQKRPAVVLTTAAALIRRVPPRSALNGMHIEFRVGEPLDPDALQAAVERIGYRVDERVDEPGEVAIRGRVVEIFPAAAPRPCRLEHENGNIVAIRSFDPWTQRSVAETNHLIIDPATECLPVAVNAGTAGPAEAKRLIGRHYGTLETLLDYVKDPEILIEDGVKTRAEEVFIAIREAKAADDRWGKAHESDYLSSAEWSALVGGHLGAVVEDGTSSARVPAFARETDPYAAFSDFARPLIKEGFRIVISGPGQTEGRSIARRAARAVALDMVTAEKWSAIRDAEADRLVFFEAPIAEGFLALEDKVAVVSLRDLAGQRVGTGALAAPNLLSRFDEVFAVGDAVVHLDHGVGVLEGVENIAASGSESVETLRLRYANDETLLVPLAEVGALWRYGGAVTNVKLDRLRGNTWEKRRNAMVAATTSMARGMVARLQEKESARTLVLKPDRVTFERFVARFPFELTMDQNAATDAILADLARGRPMDRLLCGDVGFGKTEVALRAVAAAVFAGRQAAVVAPTTILAQQHFNLFRDRFKRHGIDVVRLSRLADASELAAAKTALADGTARIAVGSHAVLAKDVAIPDLALVVIDEEQRFGARHKTQLRSLAAGNHVLTMTATPIPRTLQAGFVGLHDVSVIATPPSRRRPVKTVAGPLDEEKVRLALEFEKTRGGQSFVVCPRIEDLEPMADRLRRMVPDLAVTMLHGRMDARSMDEAMLAFARGDGDVLLATSIVESGLDVPGANTMIVWKADRFGLSQLHQLRGRVGRGTRRGLAMLATDPDKTPTVGAVKRLQTLCNLAYLGAGFAIATRDLDLRGTGDLLGDEQAGHLQLVGVALYRRMLERALTVARGGRPPDDYRPDVNLGQAGGIPADYVPEPDLRIELAVLLERADGAYALEALKAEIVDRFGPLPEPLQRSFACAERRLRCLALGIRRLDAGPAGVAATFSTNSAKQLSECSDCETQDLPVWKNGRLVLRRSLVEGQARLAAVEELLDFVERRKV